MYSLIKNLFGLIFTVFFRYKIEGTENIPAGGVIIAANHISLWDPPLIGAAMPRSVNFMAKEELFKIPVLSWIITKINAFPVKRGSADRNAIRKALNLLEEGKVLGIFPEGTRGKNGILGQPEPGVAMIAIKAGVPIVPTAIIGTNKVLKDGNFLPQFIVRCGKPIVVEKAKADKEAIENLSQQIMQEIAKLLAK